MNLKTRISIFTIFNFGYVLVIIGGGITGDVQINDTYLHHKFKKVYRLEEQKLMLEMLEANPSKIPAPSCL